MHLYLHGFSKQRIVICQTLQCITIQKTLLSNDKQNAQFLSAQRTSYKDPA